MNNNKKYIEFKNILSGCRTILDAFYFGDLYIKRNPEMRGLVYSMINGKRYDDNTTDYKTISNMLISLDKCVYEDDANQLLKLTSFKHFDKIQTRAFNRIINSKPGKPSKYSNQTSKIITLQLVDKNILPKDSIKSTIIKKCPHCNHDCVAKHDDTYVICGYTDDKIGYDHIGCKKDWCFKCEKILCKSWDIDKLYVDKNRSHNEECCKKHAKEYNKNYIDDYCQCITIK